MKPILVFDRNMKALGAMHDWKLSVARSEMNFLCLVVTDFHFSPGDASGKKCVECGHFCECFPKLLVRLPDTEEGGDK